MTGRERILAVIKGEPVDRLPLMPITMMFAADQIGVAYKEYACKYRVLVDGQLKTAERFHFDYLSAISDPAREAADLGAEIEWFDDQPPALVEMRALLADKRRLLTLEIPEPASGGRMLDRVLAVELLKRKAGDSKLVEGWVEGPCAEGADLRGLNTLMLDFLDDPAFVSDLFDVVLDLALRFAQAQIEAGADLIGIGDAAASLIGPSIYKDFVFPYEVKLIEGIHEMGALARLHICGRTEKLLPWMVKSGADILDLDWMVPMGRAREEGGPGLVLLGNIDPVKVLRNGSLDEVRAGISECHRQAGRSYIIGAGCEVVRDTPPENVLTLAEYSRANPAC